MPGGLLNIVAYGNANIILNGNPNKTFFKATYSKYTNFGLQKFRIDYAGNRSLNLTTPSVFTFKVPRNADLLMDTYLAVTLPNIWSPIMYPSLKTAGNWSPYEFKWIKDLGLQMISDITITCGSLKLQQYSGQYLKAMIERDFSNDKKQLINKMTGNLDILHNPANTSINLNGDIYPSAYAYPYTSTNGTEPSIRGRQLYIPINTWFTLDSRCAFPLIALQYNELVITVTLRPIQELFMIKDVFDPINKYPYIQPNFNRPEINMYQFLQTPPQIDIYESTTNGISYVYPQDPNIIFTAPSTYYKNKINTWNADVHLISTYCFLSNEEAALFAKEDQVYLVKDVFEYNFHNIAGSQKMELSSNGMIASWMWFLQRNDVNLRNQWSNYTNWPYEFIPGGIEAVSLSTRTEIYPDINPVNGSSTGIQITGDFKEYNQKEIMLSAGILLDGDYRENTLESGVFNYLEKYLRTQGDAPEYLYCYNFCLNTNPFEYQPSGAINLSKFRTIELEITTYAPPVNPYTSAFNVICDICGNPIGVNKSNWKLNYYNYNLTLFEERYNILSFIGGNCGMLYAR
jgi:hypothetical protein